MRLPAFIPAAAVATMLAVPASAQDRTGQLGNRATPMATTDPMMIIYRVAGVTNSLHTGEAGTATSFHCYNNSSNSELVRVRLFGYDGSTSGEGTHTLPPKATRTFSSHFTLSFSEDSVLASGTAINQGSAAIIATSRDIYCSAMIVDAGALVPTGIALHMVRFNPQPGTVE